MLGPQELIILAAIIIFLSVTGLWPSVIRGLRELRGERFDDEPRTSGRASGGGPGQNETEIFFRLLGISPSATWDEIEKAYRSKAKVHHPDRGGDEDAMRTLNEAYHRLKQLRGR